MTKCLCCSNQLLRHIRHSRVYWFCSHCWQEMPDLTEVVASTQPYRPTIKQLIDRSALTTS
ncbi:MULTISPECIES: hypothetical protein [Oscillatoriophycideae]|uniref:Uncharacterized protein n=1 Tax=Aerosakkonema funiforme FACHB-1375 TaxID=2949571 RepID=A0A926ZFX5_9CYAN|nr:MULTISPECIES: hypothetical protein [Oscillatoriales]MBD2181119.1 hypothetical protein [Aerosakkonema funiforme FACHB-1375]MBD3560487.1 hypothetical protein [Planktothrix sp. FACHB-1355]